MPTPDDAATSAPSDRTRLRRKPERGSHDFATIAAIVDEGLVAHVGFTTPDGPMVIPMAYGRVGEWLYLHGALANRALRSTIAAEVCVTVTLLDGLVLARSAYHHSMNYRSVVVVGRAERVDDPDEKRAALAAIVDHVVPGRAADSRPASESELRATLVTRLALGEASAKVRTGAPVDDDDDLALGHWAGVIPLGLTAGAPVADPHVPAGTVPPAYATAYVRPGG